MKTIKFNVHYAREYTAAAIEKQKENEIKEVEKVIKNAAESGKSSFSFYEMFDCTKEILIKSGYKVINQESGPVRCIIVSWKKEENGDD